MDLIPDVRVVRLGEERDEAGTLIRRLEQDEPEGHDGGATNVVVDVGNCDVKQTANGGVGPRTAVGHGHGVHARSTQNGILHLKNVNKVFLPCVLKLNESTFVCQLYRLTEILYLVFTKLTITRKRVL